jgi:hypothetical protein
MGGLPGERDGVDANERGPPRRDGRSFAWIRVLRQARAGHNGAFRKALIAVDDLAVLAFKGVRSAKSLTRLHN